MYEKEMFQAARTGDLTAIKNYVIRGGCLKTQTTSHRTLLLEAAEYGHFEMVSWLIEQEPLLINHADLTGITPLMQAVINGQTKVVQCLISAHADLDLQEKEIGFTALMFAENADMVRLLLTSGAKVDVVDKCKLTLLLQAIQVGNTDIVKLMIHNKANLHYRGYHDLNALELAVIHNHEDIVRELILAGANPADLHPSGHSAAALAQAKGYDKILEMFSLQGRLDSVGFNKGIPPYLLDPLSKKIINDPVTVWTGVTYDRETLKVHLAESGGEVGCMQTGWVIKSTELNRSSDVFVRNLLVDFVRAAEINAKTSSSISAEASSANAKIDEQSFHCPVTLDMMEKPITLTTGATVDQSTLEGLFPPGVASSTCPLTRQVIQRGEQTTHPNRIIQTLIEKFKNDKAVAEAKKHSAQVALSVFRPKDEDEASGFDVDGNPFCKKPKS